MFAFLLLIGIWLLLNIGVETIGELIEVAESCQIRESLVAKLFILEKVFENGERLMWFILTLPIRILSIMIDLFDPQTRN